MSVAGLAYINTLLQGIGLPYEYDEWTSDTRPETYFVGTYIENQSPYREENGKVVSTFILRGWTRGTKLGLERHKALIEENLPQRAILEDGSGIAVFYDTGDPVPTNVVGLHGIKINLNVEEWRVPRHA